MRVDEKMKSKKNVYNPERESLRRERKIASKIAKAKRIKRRFEKRFLFDNE